MRTSVTEGRQISRSFRPQVPMLAMISYEVKKAGSCLFTSLGRLIKSKAGGAAEMVVVVVLALVLPLLVGAAGAGVAPVLTFLFMTVMYCVWLSVYVSAWISLPAGK